MEALAGAVFVIPIKMSKSSYTRLLCMMILVIIALILGIVMKLSGDSYGFIRIGKQIALHMLPQMSFLYILPHILGMGNYG